MTTPATPPASHDGAALDIAAIRARLEAATKYHPLPWKWDEYGVFDADRLNYVLEASDAEKYGDSNVVADDEVENFIVNAPADITALLAHIDTLAAALTAATARVAELEAELSTFDHLKAHHAHHHSTDGKEHEAHVASVLNAATGPNKNLDGDEAKEHSRCPKCGSTNYEDLTSGKDAPWWHCDDCHHDWMDDDYASRWAYPVATQPSAPRSEADYDPHIGEGDKEDGWGKCVVCQAFTIDPDTGRCIHWDKDVEHHEAWYGEDEPPAPAPTVATTTKPLTAERACDHDWEDIDHDENYSIDVCMNCGLMKLLDKKSGEVKFSEGEPDPTAKAVHAGRRVMLYSNSPIGDFGVEIYSAATDARTDGGV